MHNWKRLSLLALSGMMAFSLSGCSRTSPEEEQRNFDSFIDKQFVQAMESDYTTAHVFLENPESFGVDASKLKVNLGERIDMDAQKEAGKKVTEAWREFHEFDRDKLTEEQQDTYDIYEFQNNIVNQLNEEKFDYYQQLFASISGIHYQLPTLLADWDVRNEQDVKDLIALVKDVQPYMKGAISYTKTQAEKGLLMMDIKSVKEYCDGILKKGDESAVLTSMYENIEALKLGDKKNETYKKELKAAFTTSFLPAYQDISDLMQELSKGKNNEDGLASFENGKAYYELLLQNSIGSEKSIADVKKMLEEDLKTQMSELQSLISKDSSIFKTFLSGKLPSTGYKSYEAILDDIRSQLSEDFPTVSNLKYNIKDINKEIASSSGVAAYFNIPPLDGNGEKQLRVNPDNGEIGDITTYHTVAHEGFPGHMYQYGYMYENLKSPYRKSLANSNAYTEGYAVYAQYYAFKYLKDINQDLLSAVKANELASYDIIILADIGIHYDGWSYDEFKEYMTSKGLALKDSDMKTQYQQLQANPCAFEPYYVGYKEISLLKENAQSKLGDKFEDKAFHEALLKSGNAPFRVVERNIDKYIKSVK